MDASEPGSGPNRVRAAARSIRTSGHHHIRKPGLVRDTSWGMILELVRLSGALTTFVYLGQRLGPASYGRYSSLFATATVFFSILAGLGLAVIQRIAADLAPVQRTVRSFMTVLLVSSGVCAVVAAFVVLDLVDNVSTLTVVAFVVSELVLSPGIDVAAAVSMSRGDFVFRTKVQVAHIVVRLLVIVAVSLVGALSIESIVMTNVVAFGVLMVVVRVLVTRREQVSLAPGPVALVDVRSSVVFSVPLVAFAIFQNGDKIVLAQVVSEEQLGLYFAAYRLVSFGFLPIDALINSTHLRFLDRSTHGTRHQRSRALRFTGLSTAYSLVAMACVVAFSWVGFGILGDKYAGARIIMLWLAPLLLVHGLWPFALSGLLGLGRPGWRSAALIGSAVWSTLLYLWLISEHGWRGGVMATLIAETLLGVVAWAALLVAERHPGPIAVAQFEGDDERPSVDDPSPATERIP